jgi:hypothetical protein
MPNQFRFFSEIVKSAKFAGFTAKAIVERLSAAGEVYLHMQSGRAHIIHLGDEGEMTEETLTYKDKLNETHVVILAYVEEIKNHRGEVE